MKIILALNNEQPNKLITNLKELYFPIQTKDIDQELQDRFYCEVGKQIHIVRHNLLNNEKYIGISQNKRIFKDLYENNLTDIQNLLQKFNMLAIKANLGRSIFNLQQQDALLLRLLNAKENKTYYLNNIQKTLNNLLTEEQINIAKNTTFTYAHNMFITTKDLFYQYSKYLDQKLKIYKNSQLYQRIKHDPNIPIYNKKQGAWFGQSLLTIFCIKRKLKVGQVNLI